MKIKKEGNKEETVPYGPYKYRQIMDDCYLISHQLHTSYTDLLLVTPTEREGLLKNCKEELRLQKEENNKLKAKQKQKSS